MNWYRRYGRDLPWRHTHDPYAILVSEFMLQQTQVATALPYYNEWFRRFPDFSALAHASESDVLHAWQGLGYRVLARIFNLQTSIDKTAGREFLWNRAKQLVPECGVARFNSALVDFGALICLPRKPRCRICPVRKFCRATNPEILPVRKTRPRIKQLTENHALVVRQNKILLERSRGRWRGMWILPSLQTRAPKRQPLYRSIFPFTHHRITLAVYRHRAPPNIFSNQTWFEISALENLAMPSPHRRATRHLLTAGRAGRSLRQPS